MARRSYGATQPRLKVFALALFVVPLQLGGIDYDERPSDPPPIVTTGDYLANVTFSQVGGHISASLADGSTIRIGTSTCELTVTRLPTMEAVMMPEQVPANAIPVRINCGRAELDRRWITPADIQDVDGEARRAAQSYVESVLGPRLSIQTSPPANILVGLSTWFWMGGWDASPLRTTVTAPWGDTISVEMTLDHVMWDYGDGTAPKRGDLGQAYPAESSVQHVYTDRSTSRDHPDGTYQMSATVRLNVQYWYDGGGPYSAGTIERVHSAPVIVRQLQAVIH